MSQIKMMPKKLAVLKIGKSTKSNNGAFFTPETTDALGTIEYISDDMIRDDLKVGTKIYFGDRRQQIRMAGKELEIMEIENIIAILEE